MTKELLLDRDRGFRLSYRDSYTGGWMRGAGTVASIAEVSLGGELATGIGGDCCSGVKLCNAPTAEAIWAHFSQLYEKKRAGKDGETKSETDTPLGLTIRLEQAMQLGVQRVALRIRPVGGWLW